MIEKIIKSINLSELGEMGSKAFITFLLKYEEFLREMKKFTCHFPNPPNKLIFNLVNEYIKFIKEKSIRLIFFELLDEDWNYLKVNSKIFKDKIISYLLVKEDFLKMTKLFDDEIF